MNATYTQSIAVHFDYPVHFSKGIFDPDNPVLIDAITRLEPQRQHKALIFVDEGLAQSQPTLCSQVQSWQAAYPEQITPVDTPILMPGGEKAKTVRENLEQALNAIGNEKYRLCRQSVILAIGGGSFLDIIGLAASLVHRGLRIVRVPTTVLAQNDAAVGVKNGVDLNGQKNFLGTFAPPFAVVCDFDLLDTLTDKYWHGGIAEAFKVAIIQDAEFFAFLCENASALRQRDKAAMEQLIKRCAILHLEHIRNSGDPFEAGTARPLDFGHWSAHKLEVMSDYEIGHGQAVAIGMAIDACYAEQLRLITTQDRNNVLNGLRESGLAVYSPLLDERNPQNMPAVLSGLTDFREHLGGELTLTLPNGIGRKTELHTVDNTLIIRAIAFLKTLTEETVPCK